MNTFTNMNDPKREMTPDELKMFVLAQEGKPVFVTDDEGDEEKPSTEAPATLH